MNPIRKQVPTMFCSNILVAFDGSEMSEIALGKAVMLAKTDPGIRMNILIVVKPRVLLGSPYVTADESILDGDLQNGQELADKAEKLMKSAANLHSVSLALGTPQDEILKFAKEQGCDLIVMGSRGLSGLKEFILGSVSHFVAQHAEVLVLIVK
ncbi:universal stress protein [Paenibacillus cremeus]|nr:universal stress protein [Paenibacillus cremeus]